MTATEAGGELHRAGFVLRLIALLGLVAGLAEVGLFAAQKFILHLFIFVGRDVVWMAPLAELMLFLALGILFLLVRRLFPRLTWVSALTFFGSLAVMAMLWMYTPFHKGAALLLALGIGVQGARLAGRRPAAVAAVVRVGLPLTFALTLALGLGVRGLRWWQERRAIAALPNAPSHSPITQLAQSFASPLAARTTAS